MIWDLPTRLFHWSLVICVIGAYGSITAGNIDLHEKFGLSVLGLVVFRILWGFVGHAPSRFSNFVPSPTVLASYLKNWKNPKPGHNPLGALSVLALLSLLLVQTLSGSFSTDDILFEGPLLHLAPGFSDTAFSIHNLVRVLIFLMIFLHWSALLVHRFVLKEKLTGRMITGGTAKDKPGIKRTVLGVALLIACLAGAHSLVLLKS
ncbi:MAG: cytochrome b/b6 domain-containing protein [Parvibaculales bacterium]